MLRVILGATFLLAFGVAQAKAPVSEKVGSAQGALLPEGWLFVNDPAPVLASARASAEQSVRKVDQGAEVTGIWLPLGERTPVAAFQNGAHVTIVVQGKHVLTMPDPDRAGSFGTVTSRIVGTATVVDVTCPDAEALLLRPVSGGWSLFRKNGKNVGKMLIGQEGEALTLTPPEQGGAETVLTFQDPGSGRRLLLGLSRGGEVSSDLVQSGQGFSVRPSLVGVVVAADSDAIELRQAGGRFFLDAVGPTSQFLAVRRGLSASGASVSGVRLGQGGRGEQDVREAWKAVAAATAGQRFSARMRLAQAAARAGFGPLLSQVLDVALDDEPEGSGRSDVRRLQQVSAVLNRRAVSDLLLQEEGDAPEDQFWRGMVRVQFPLSGSVQKDSPEQVAHLIAAGLPVVPGYAAALRRQVLPQAAEWVARYGDKRDRATLEALPVFPETALARGLLAMRSGGKSSHLQLDVLARSASPIIWPVAQEALLRAALETGEKSPEDVARLLDGWMPAFRLAGRERDARLLEIDALLRGKNWRSALRRELEARNVFGGDDFSGEARLLNMAQGLVQRGASNNEEASEDIALLQKSLAVQGLAPSVRPYLLQALVQRYGVLGLPDRQRAVLRELLSCEQGDERRATGVRLAALDLAGGDAEAALRDLPDEVPRGVAALPGGGPEEPSDIILMRARIAVARGDVKAARAVLEGRTELEALEMAADLAERSLDWRGSVLALQGMLKGVFAEQGTALTELQEKFIMRLAGDASHAKDEGTLRMLKERFGPLMNSSVSAGVFHLLTGDIERSGGGVSGQ